jgi:hypothetical protein
MTGRMMTVADSDLPVIDLDPRAVRSTAGKLMTVPIIAFPRPDGRTPLLGSFLDLKRARLTLR